MTEFNEKTKIAKGTMNLMSDNPHWWITPCAALYAVGLLAAFPFLITFFQNRSVVYLIGILILLPFALTAQFVFVAARSGKRCEYEADGEKFIIRRKNMPEDCFFYSETLSVKVEPFIMAWNNCGYKVTIETKYRTVVYYYAFSGPNSKTEPNGTPFTILRERIPQRTYAGSDRNEFANADEMISGDEFYENEKKKEP